MAVRERTDAVTGTETSTGGRWRGFAGAMILLAGVFNLLDGVVAVAKAGYVDNDVLFANLDAWGWLMIVVGAVLCVTGFAIFSGSVWASLVGIFAAGFNALCQLAFLRHYPIWSVIIIAVDVLVIYGLTVYGDGRDRPRSVAR